mmetsp:Transcript_5597/g.8246  ORF Transcript_5597/g.8246 Transcript_5597/m.8246 type:complete len:379 (-) Transcript_5597:122-1258(-)|eukprot:CAMPEP_0172414922 /NCGR_PEP_ID=MMETSP1064-20121228/1515_1 /TAXON_ID=202472 /ORGANISM="Aulacoseira subarctica , Strain CCAP 1002/5" /LENGTH=378 /DNA_ID=CAMNT_0013151795 /DNA_START=123 /DNA_END=1259 /DNA_ORIENTATION=-
MSSHHPNKKSKAAEHATAAVNDAKGTSNSAVSRPAARYVYRDFSRVPPDDGETVLGAIVAPPFSNPDAVKHQKLPIKLNALLDDPEMTHIIAWMPHGRAWRILNPKQFVKEVLTKYFDYCNYNSFVRLINAWGFRRLASGPDRHAYYHELFLRGLPHLHSRMRRVTGRDEKPPIDQEDEPDLYRISQLYPVPPAPGSQGSTLSVPTVSTLASAAGSSASVASTVASFPAYGGPAYSSLPAAVPLHNIRDNTTFSGNAATASFLNAARTLGMLSNPYTSLAAQFQQASEQLQRQQQESYRQLLASSSLPPSYAQQQYELACFSSLLQGAVGRPPAAPRMPLTNASGEAPIMYIPVYPSTLAGLSNPSQEDQFMSDKTSR